MQQITSLNCLRLFATLLVVLVHIGHIINPWPIQRGQLVVELFFILSGFFLARTYEKYTKIRSNLSSPKNNISLCRIYFFRRFIRLWPEYIFAMLIYMCLCGLFTTTEVEPFFLNVFFLTFFGGNAVINPTAWYVIVVFWASILLFNLLINFQDKAKTIFLPALLIIALSYSFFTHRYPIAFLRGLVGLIVGIYTYWFCLTIKAYEKKINQEVLSILLLLGETISIIGLCYIFIFSKEGFSCATNIYFYASFLIGLLYLKKEKILTFFSWEIWNTLAKISYSLYLTHYVIIEIAKTHYASYIRNHVILGSGIIVLLALILAYLCYKMQKVSFKVLKNLILKK